MRARDEQQVVVDGGVCCPFLPPELCAIIFAYLRDDPYHMLTLPSVSHVWRSACSSASPQALRLAARLRMVAEMLQAAPSGPLDAWALSHALAAVAQYEHLLLDGGLDLLRATPTGHVALLAVLRRCAKQAVAMPPAPPPAEVVFLEEHMRRSAARQQHAMPTVPAAPGPATASRAARVARPSTPGGELELREMRARRMLEQEMHAQAQRHGRADARRRWQQLSRNGRGAWERSAAAAQRRWERHCRASREAAALATCLLVADGIPP